MAYEGLTPKQIEFIKKYLIKVGAFNRKREKAYNEELVASYRALQDRITSLRRDVDKFGAQLIAASMKAQIDTADNIVGRNPDVPDIPGAHAALDVVEAMLLAGQRADEWQARRDRLEPTMKKALGSLVKQKAEIQTAWTDSEEAAALGAKRTEVAPYDRALRRLDAVEELIRQGVAEQKIIQRIYETPTGAENIGTVVAVSAAKTALDVEVANYKATVESLGKTFKPDLPPALLTITGAIDQIVSNVVKTDAYALNSAAAEVKTKVAELKEAAKTPIAERQKWLSDLAAVEARLSTLRNHRQAGNAQHIVPRINVIQGDINVATGKAAAHDYVGASAQIAGLADACSETITLADAISKFKAIVADRNERIGQIDGLGGSAHATVAALINEAKAKRNSAVALASQTPPDFVAAVKALNEMPPMIDQAVRLSAFANWVNSQIVDYKNEYQGLKSWQDGLNPADAPLDPDLPALDKVIKDVEALMGVTNEAGTNRGQAIEKAGGIISTSGHFKTAIKTRKTNAEKYYAARADHAARLAKFEGKPGEEAVREYVGRMKADATQAEGAASRKEYHVGTQLLESSRASEAAMLKQLELGAAFFPKYDEVRKLLEKIEGKEDKEDPDKSIAPDPNREKAADLIAEVKRLRAEAYSKGVAQRDWETATSLVEAAKARVEEAAKMLAAVKSLEAGKRELGEDTQNFTAAFAAYGTIRSAAETYAAGAFGEKFTQADDAMKRASDDNSGPDVVKSSVEAANAICETIISLAGKKKAYETARTAADTQHKAKVVPADTPENGIHEQREKIDKLLEEASDLAKPEVYDFDRATAKIAEALTLANAVPAMLAARDAVKDKIKNVKDLITKLEGPQYAAGCGKEIDRLKKVLTDFEAAEKSLDLGKMKSIAEAGDALVAPYDALGEDYKKFVQSNRQAHCKERWDLVKDLVPDLDDSQFPQRKRTHDFVTSFNHHVARHNYKAALEAYGPVYWSSETAILAAKQWGEYKPVKLDTRNVLDAKAAVADAADTKTTDALAELEKRFKAAESWETVRFDYVKAKAMMEEIITDANALDTEIADFKSYVTKIGELDVAIDALEEADKADGVKPVLDRLRNKKANAVAMADGGDRTGAIDLLTEAIGEAGAATGDAAAVGSFADAVGKIATDATEPGADLAKLCDDAAAQISSIVRQMDGVALMPRLLELGDRIEAAKAGLPGDADAAKSALADVAVGLVEIRKEMAHHAQIMREIDTAVDLIGPLVSGHKNEHPQADYSSAEAQSLLDGLSTARNLLRSDRSKADDASKAIEDALRKYHPLKAAADAHILYVDLRDQVRPLIDEMEEHDSRYAIQDEMVEFRTRMTEAENKALDKKHEEAKNLVNQAKAIHAGAMLQAKMAGNGTPTEAEVLAIINGPGGEKAFDDIVKTLDPNATRVVLRVAFEARFGCTLTMLEKENKNAAGEVTGTVDDPDIDAGKAKKGPNMRALYDAMCLLPAADTLTNESLLGVTRVAEGGGASDHHPGTKVMTMREGDVMYSAAYGIGLDYELEGVPENLRPKPGKEVRRFDWNTLHEVGHAVDDKLNFTNRHLKNPSFGGWEYPSKDVGPFAEVIAKHFNFDKDYVTQVMLHNTNPPVPENPNPDSIEPDEWERRRITVKAWLENTFSGRNPWQTTSSAKACEIKGRCYHESMPGYWVSYPIEERSKGVTGYQFRSPLEWFSELYAAYHTGRLADGHPAETWLSKLKNPAEV